MWPRQILTLFLQNTILFLFVLNFTIFCYINYNLKLIIIKYYPYDELRVGYYRGGKRIDRY